MPIDNISDSEFLNPSELRYNLDQFSLITDNFLVVNPLKEYSLTIIKMSYDYPFMKISYDHN